MFTDTFSIYSPNIQLIQGEYQDYSYIFNKHDNYWVVFTTALLMSAAGCFVEWHVLQVWNIFSLHMNCHFPAIEILELFHIDVCGVLHDWFLRFLAHLCFVLCLVAIASSNLFCLYFITPVVWWLVSSVCVFCFCRDYCYVNLADTVILISVSLPASQPGIHPSSQASNQPSSKESHKTKRWDGERWIQANPYSSHLIL